MLSSSSNGANFKVLSSIGQCGLERVCVAPRISELDTENDQQDRGESRLKAKRLLTEQEPPPNPPI
jgi:hypothetical protein